MLGLVSASSGNTVNLQVEAGEFLRELNIYRGYPDGTLGLERPISRAEFATLMVRITGANVSSGTLTFQDVQSSHWAYSDIATASTNGWVNGYTDGTFKPSGNITYAETLTMLVRVLGYEGEVTGEWPQGHIAVADNLGITKYLTLDRNHVVSRGEVAVLLREALFVEVK